MRAIVVAIHNDGTERSSVSIDKSSKCRMMATKITKDILLWIKETSGTALYEKSI